MGRWERAELRGPGNGAQAAGYFLFQLGHPDVAFGAIVCRGNPPVPGKQQVVVLAVQQAAWQRMVFLDELVVPFCGLAGPDQRCGPVAVTSSTSAPASAPSLPFTIASLTSACIPVSASAAWAAQHHWPGGARSVTACISRRACAQQSWWFA